MLVILIFFFFQAEDGIRDGTVTGVQTCALPILMTHSQHMRLHCLKRHATEPQFGRKGPHDSISQESARTSSSGVGSHTRKDRSEERRVGKECRSRWSTYQ